MLAKITYSQIQFIKIIMSCNLERVYRNYVFAQKPVYYFYVKDAQGNVTTTYKTKNFISNYYTVNATVSSKYYSADVIAYSDYYPFGMLMPNRHGQSDGYRYGFNGMEKDDEVRGTKGASYDFGMRMHDPRIGRFLSLDPDFSKYPFMSPYCFAGNSPILLVDIEGRGPGKRKLVNGDGTKFLLSDIRTIINSKGGIQPARTGDMVPSINAVLTTISFESLSLHLYDNDGSRKGNATIGFGHKLHNGPITADDEKLYKNGITQDVAVDLLMEDIKSKIPTLNNLAKNRGLKGKLSQGEFNVAFDLYFNAGTKKAGQFLDKLSKIEKLKSAGKTKKADRKYKKWKSG